MNLKNVILNNPLTEFGERKLLLELAQQVLQSEQQLQRPPSSLLYSALIYLEKHFNYDRKESEEFTSEIEILMANVDENIFFDPAWRSVLASYPSGFEMIFHKSIFLSRLTAIRRAVLFSAHTVYHCFDEEKVQRLIRVSFRVIYYYFGLEVDDFFRQIQKSGDYPISTTAELEEYTAKNIRRIHIEVADTIGTNISTRIYSILEEDEGQYFDAFQNLEESLFDD